MDNSSVSDAEVVLRAHNITVNKRIQDPSSNSFEISWFNDRKIRSALFRPRVFQYIPDPITGELFLQFVDKSIKSIRPDVAIAYGGFWLASKLLRIVHNNDVKSVFTLHNFAYNDRELFTNVDLTIVPSFFEESFARVAAESIINGIPTIGSDRGALPETIGEAGGICHIDEKYTPRSRLTLTEQDVRPWIDEIVRLWDDPSYYEEKRNRSLHRAKRWDRTDVLNFCVGCVNDLLER